jgi:hypothetical protein
MYPIPSVLRVDSNNSWSKEEVKRETYPTAIPASPSCMSPNIALAADSASFSFSLIRIILSCDSRVTCARIWPSHCSFRPVPPSRANGPASAFASSARLSSSSTCALIGLIDSACKDYPTGSNVSVSMPHLEKRHSRNEMKGENEGCG